METELFARDRPTLKELGADLLQVSRAECVVSLALPFVTMAGFFVAGSHQLWVVAFLFVVTQSFFTYASVSHDLAHSNLGLSRRANEVFLCLIELLSLRSGHAFRVVHLHHHKHFPSEDDIEGRTAGLTLWEALKDGPKAQFRNWLFAIRRSRGATRAWIVGEGLGVLFLLALCLGALKWTIAPAVYAVLVIGGSWFYPIATAWMVHDPEAEDELHHTRLFRGRLVSWLAFEHLYHLEHHLYPAVPHHRWPELARRLDPYFETKGLKPIVLLF